MTHQIPTLDAKGLRNFALATGAIVSTLFGVLLPWLLGFPLPIWPWTVAFILVAWGLIAPSTLQPVYKGWMLFGLFMSKIMTPLIMGLLFFLLMTPMAFVMKLMQRDPMARALNVPQDTYRVTTTKAPRNRMERPY